jgi:hypothetical protein
VNARALSVVGFLLAAIAAPAISVAMFLMLSKMTGIRLQGPPLGPDLPLAFAFATVLGLVPSLFFGGLTLLTLRVLFAIWPPGVLILAVGGLAAAALYCLVFGLTGMGPWGVGSPWKAPDSSLIVVSILLSGALAGLIYAAFARRG